MAKTLDPKAIEAERQTSSRAERREQKRRQMQDEISYNQRGNGVIVIPPQKRREVAEEPPKLRVAAYCRVSTQEEQQVGSFDMQIHHFTKRIEANPQWELVEIYQDEGISATTVEKRLGFQKMIADAVDGKIDLILTKSISRFGRNIVDILDSLSSKRGDRMTYISGLENLLEIKKQHPEYQMILHSDQGSVYASKAYNDLLPMYVVRSMSRAGTPTDNSAMESINGWIKAELFMDFHVTGERPVYEEVNEYIKFFNEERPAYALSYLTPKQYRERYAA